MDADAFLYKLDQASNLYSCGRLDVVRGLNIQLRVHRFPDISLAGKL